MNIDGTYNHIYVDAEKYYHTEYAPNEDPKDMDVTIVNCPYMPVFVPTKEQLHELMNRPVITGKVLLERRDEPDIVWDISPFCGPKTIDYLAITREVVGE